jgi:hypothetical protein
MTAESCSPVVASGRSKYDGDFRVQTLLDAQIHSHSIIPRSLRQRAMRNIEMAVEPEEGVKQAHGRLQPTLPV